MTFDKRFSSLYWIGGSLGSDPECFVVDQNNEMIPSFEFLKAKEEKDYIIEQATDMMGNVYDYGKQPIFWDGYQGEFNVFDSDCLSWVCDSTFLGLKTLNNKANEYKKGAKVTIQNTFDIDLDTIHDLDPRYIEFGCMPSYNIYGMKGVSKQGHEVSFRSAGGHIHFGISDQFNHNKKEKVSKYVKALDAILGVACVSLFAQYDDPRRRTMYGLSGEYRLPPHGLEYRTLSNAWLSHPLIMNMVFELARKAIVVGHNDLLQYWKATEEETIYCINNCDIALSREILARNKEIFTGILYSIRRTEESANQMYKVYMSGMESIIKDPNDIVNNWRLDKVWDGHCEGLGMNIKTMNISPLYNDLKNDTSIEIYEQMIKDIREIEERIEKPVAEKKQTA